MFTWAYVLLNYLHSQRLRKRVKVYSGSNEKVLQKLQVYGLSKDSVPSELGGNVVLDHKNWLYERKASSL